MKAINEYCKLERNNSRPLIDNYSEAVNKYLFKLNEVICALYWAPHTKVYGLGAPAKATTLLTAYKNKFGGAGIPIKYATEVPGSRKIGKYIPGTDILIINEDEVGYKYLTPDFYFIFSHNFTETLIEHCKVKPKKGWIVPFPEPKIIYNKDSIVHDKESSNEEV